MPKPVSQELIHNWLKFSSGCKDTKPISEKQERYSYRAHLALCRQKSETTRQD